MGTISFELPGSVPPDQLAELERACIAGGQDNMPFPTRTSVVAGRLICSRDNDESGSLLVPWPIAQSGQFMSSSATLMERVDPYLLTLELARGKINQVRSQAADWLMGGLMMGDPLTQQIHRATHALAHAIAALPGPETSRLAELALIEGYRAATSLVQAYTTQVFQVRHSRQPKFESSLTCRLQAHAPTDAIAKPLLEACNSVAVPLPWRDIEPIEGTYNWEPHDRLVSWATARNLRVVGGPLVDFSGRNLPDWIWERESDLLSLNHMLCDHIDRVVRRYPQIKSWLVTSGSNCAGVLATRDEELLWLTVRLAEAVRKLGQNLDVVVGVAQPWGDYLAEQERTQSPFLFADTLMRTGVKVSALDLEIVMGVTPRGSYCRDTLDVSRILDLYALLGVPLQVTLGYPSEPIPGPHSDPDQRPGAGLWAGGYTPDAQADWAGAFASLALCKPFVRAVHWSHLSDAEPHQFPACGLIDSTGAAKPVLKPLARLRAEHLK